jgi:hypothetical protein
MEKWKIIEDYPDYSISTAGKVMRTTAGRGLAKIGRVLKPLLTEDGYLYVDLYGNCGHRKLKIHKLVAQAFIVNPDNKPEVHHIDTVKTHNIPKNLQWVTRLEHSKLSAKLGQKSWHLQGRGVHFIKRLGKWAARYQKVWLGCFDTKNEALKAREVAILERS